MKLRPLSVCQFAFFGFCCVLITVREADSTFVPGRCLCPQTQQRVRGPLNKLTVYPKSPNCHNMTVIVTLRRNNQLVCLNPEAPLGKQLIRCWNRAHKLGRSVKMCLRRRKVRGGQQPRQRKQHHNSKQSPSNSQ